MADKIETMGIVNLTPDSFFSGSRCLDSDGRIRESWFEEHLMKMVEDGADILDFGACSTRPGAKPAGEEEEWRRLSDSIVLARKTCPETQFSIDTFRPEIVRKAYDLIGPFIVNDVSGGSEPMWNTVGELGLPYVAMHTCGTPDQPEMLQEDADVTAEVTSFFEMIEETADRHGVRNWILDPGFGFSKSVEQNWELLRRMGSLRRFGKRILAGLSRKSFLYRPLGIMPDEAMPATQTANLIALQNGAGILRVHDVRPTVQTIRLYELSTGKF